MAMIVKLPRVAIFPSLATSLVKMETLVLEVRSFIPPDLLFLFSHEMEADGIAVHWRESVSSSSRLFWPVIATSLFTIWIIVTNHLLLAIIDGQIPKQVCASSSRSKYWSQLHW